MANAPANSVDVRIQGKEYRVSCAPEEKTALEAAVQLLDGRLAEAAARTPGSSEKLAVMVALNLAHELLAVRDGKPLPVPVSSLDDEDSRRRIKAIEAKLDAALAEKTQENLF